MPVVDTITDYTFTSPVPSDVIDLSQLVTLGLGDSVTNFVRYNQATGRLQVDVDGTATANGWVTVVQLTTSLPGSVSVRVDGSAAVLTLTNTAFPLALDMDGDGVEFLDLSAGVTFDYGDGSVATAWISPDDALLGRWVDGRFDVAFIDDAAGAQTDLDGLRLAYDSNGDNLLDGADSAFGDFQLWQDADADGVVDAGETQTLAEAGIASISLMSDGMTGIAANGDVYIAGQAVFTKVNGSTGVLSDTAFRTDELQRLLLPPLLLLSSA